VYDIVLECRNVSHWFGPKKVLYDINLKVARGQIVALVGPSGCGKSTLFRAILGTHPPCAGQVLMNGVPVTGANRECGIVYQRYSLFPFLTAEENVAFGLMLDGTALPFRWFQFWKWWPLRKAHIEHASALLARLGLSHSLRHYPAEMSGGMCQRVAIAQALIMKPQVLLLDEPFGALDESTREDLQTMLLELYQENLKAKKEGRKPPYTILIVTHELTEAIYVADRVAGLSQYWQWEERGLPESPGATIIYDDVAPVFGPEDHRDHAVFLQQRRELRRVVFEPDHRPRRDEHLRFWRACQEGRGTGIMAP
jgi:NitT/TauT family transport system ATP-binding protein